MSDVQERRKGRRSSLTCTETGVTENAHRTPSRARIPACRVQLGRPDGPPGLHNSIEGIVRG